MDNRVYYGQYSLSHWLDLILKKNIILPDYQRYFVWNQDKVITLIDTFKKQEFVPPITIGAFKDGDLNVNLILDGQQRLTSILLAYLKLYPDKKEFKSKIESLRLANENDDDMDDIEEQFDDILAWDFSNLTDKGKTREEILQNLVPGNYRASDLNVDDEFFKKTFLGFSYLVPHGGDQLAQQRFYSSVFRNINIQGERLLPQESRASLYFLNKDLAAFFEPDFITNYKVKNQSLDTSADFVRFLSLLSQYAKDTGSGRVARGYKLKMEKYYEDFVYSMVGDTASHWFKPFSELFPDRNYAPRFEQLKRNMEALEIPMSFASIIDMDVYFFGLIYKVVFGGRDINPDRKGELKAALDDAAAGFRSDYGHRKAPAALKYLRARMDASIGIFNTFMV
ncbi:DUF262 domain-containing protein [Mucilaginibacter psychrotolerans]|uniref:DUF262 domain-containing protein n=2 Tax=Mucilaginibacter psychrotolerans TaxID=1524096 RepID=A0A4Y8SFZ1_9SPHI|nr:DUF262 domain-containing protein [Mucilaginibacter psychrotolerans]